MAFSVLARSRRHGGETGQRPDGLAAADDYFFLSQYWYGMTARRTRDAGGLVGRGGCIAVGASRRRCARPSRTAGPRVGRC